MVCGKSFAIEQLERVVLDVNYISGGANEGHRHVPIPAWDSYRQSVVMSIRDWIRAPARYDYSSSREPRLNLLSGDVLNVAKWLRRHPGTKKLVLAPDSIL